MKTKTLISLFVVVSMILIATTVEVSNIGGGASLTTIEQPVSSSPTVTPVKILINKSYVIKQATITAYNTVEWQTDEFPCIAKGGYICGRSDVVACPRDIPLNTIVIISGNTYECLDWTALKYNGRFDISFDKDIQGAIQWGKQTHDVIVLEE